MLSNQLSQIPNLESRISDLLSPNLVWNERYRQLLMLGKSLPSIDINLKTEDQRVQGCESDLWLVTTKQTIEIDSNARIIRGLAVLVLHAINNCSDLEQAQHYFEQSVSQAGLSQHLAQSRSNGITSLWKAIHSAHNANQGG
ncbi:SufE family protein [Alginatibacterium sediminis]|uniref:SufE family protein n=1 Tax=Alginatibacterium sediminis TaxID=2164068 RepID=A0A420EGL6_9ALTE|nr:SufE family protein [Alginatibacterium sediminis]RKF19829.1 SufE family protein [Alginatibacterium sediminis]